MRHQTTRGGREDQCIQEKCLQGDDHHVHNNNDVHVEEEKDREENKTLKIFKLYNLIKRLFLPFSLSFLVDIRALYFLTSLT